MKKLKINKGWFYGAGSVYKWNADGYSQYGVGIKRTYFDEEVIRLDIDGIAYTLDMEKAREFVNKYKSFKVLGKTKLGIVSKSLLKPIKTIDLTPTEESPKQLSLL